MTRLVCRFFAAFHYAQNDTIGGRFFAALRYAQNDTIGLQILRCALNDIIWRDECASRGARGVHYPARRATWSGCVPGGNTPGSSTPSSFQSPTTGLSAAPPSSKTRSWASIRWL